MRILGLDPGSIHTGYGLLEKRGSRLVPLHHGRVSCNPRHAVPARLARLAEEMEALLARLRPDAAALETPFHGLNARSLIVLSEARGVLLAVLARRGLEIREYSPAEVKSAVTGSGRAGKEQVARMVRMLLGMDRGSGEAAERGGMPASDASDALAVAICCANRLRMDRLAGVAGSLRGVHKSL